MADVDTRLRHATAGLQSSPYDRPREPAAHSGRSDRETAANVVPCLVQVACAQVTDVEAGEEAVLRQGHLVSHCRVSLQASS